MNVTQTIAARLAVGCLVAAVNLLPNVGYTQDAKVVKAMAVMKSMADQLGPPKIEGMDNVAGKSRFVGRRDVEGPAPSIANHR